MSIAVSRTGRDQRGLGRAAPRRAKRKGRWVGVWFVLPATLYIVVYLMGPVVYGFALSFTEYSPLSRGGPEPVGLANYAAIVQDTEFLRALGVTARYTLQVLPCVVILALVLAVLANRPFRGVGIFRAALYVPHIVSLTAVSMIWLWLYSNNGLVNEILGALGLTEQRWLAEPDSALNAVSAMRVWKALGSNMVLLLAGLQSIPRELYEAVKVDGATAWQSFRYVTLPGLRPMLTFVVAMDIIYLSQSFAELFVLTQGGPLGSTTTVNYLIYNQAFQYNDMGTASAMAFVLFALVVGFSYATLRAMTRRG